MARTSAWGPAGDRAPVSPDDAARVPRVAGRDAISCHVHSHLHGVCAGRVLPCMAWLGVSAVRGIVLATSHSWSVQHVLMHGLRCVVGQSDAVAHTDTTTVDHLVRTLWYGVRPKV